MNLLKFLRKGQAAQEAVNELGHGAPAGAKGHETARVIAKAVEGRFIGDEIHDCTQCALEMLAAIMNNRHKFRTMTPGARSVAAHDLEGLGKCCYTLAAHLKGDPR